jgi:hypothetical protein
VSLYQEHVRGLVCEGDCMAPPRSALEFAWPSADAVVKVPMKHYLGELSLRVAIDGLETWALLDSGAGLTIVESGSPAGRRFASSLTVSGSGSSQAISAALGQVQSLRVGALELRHLPAASVPIPALDGMGKRRPDVILGFSLFLGSVIHIDYAKGEIAFAKKAEKFVSQASHRIPMRILDGKPVADVRVGASTGPFLLDTGNAGGLDMIKPWAEANGFPGSRSSAQMQARTGAGTQASSATYFRLEHAALGPIVHDDRLVQIDSPPNPGVLAGLIGNEVFARCPSVTFDVQNRNLWLELPCDRPSVENKSGLRLMRADDAAFPATPWVVEAIMPGGPGATAGILVGDRILMVAGAPADLEIEKIREVMQRPAGTKIPVALSRSGKRMQVEMTLARLLAR